MAEAIVLVTGASRGIGRAVARAFAARGHRVIGTATRADGAEAIRATLADYAEPGAGAVLDVGDQGSVDSLFAELSSEGSPPGRSRQQCRYRPGRTAGANETGRVG